MTQLSFQIDDYLREYMEMNTVWIANLSDGSIVYQDDYRPNSGGPAWIRLKRYLSENELKLETLHFVFRKHWEFVGQNVYGFYYSRCIRGYPVGGHNSHYFIGGIIYNEYGDISYKKFNVPALIVQDSYKNNIRTLTDIVVENHIIFNGPNLWKN